MVQEVVGQKVGPYFLPAFAGVAFSHNELRWSPRISREDGLVRLVPGLGTRAVDRVGDDYPVLLAPLRVGDDEATAMRKIRVVAAYLDILIHRRIWNFRATGAALKEPFFLAFVAPGKEAKYAATFAMSSLLSWPAIAFMMGFLREPSFSAFS